MAKKNLGLDGRKIISTFGLVSRGKGLERHSGDAGGDPALSGRALPYLGETHPRCAGTREVYRNELDEWVRRLGAAGMCASITATSRSKNWSTT